MTASAVRRPGRPWADLDRQFDGSDLSGLRASLADRAGAYDADRRQVDVLLLIASELATNAVRHGGGQGRLQLWHRGTTFCCRVTDAGPGLALAELRRPRAEATATGGRGLWICRKLARLLYVHAGRNAVGAVVTAIVAAKVQDNDRPRVREGAAAIAERSHELLDTSHYLCRRAAAATAIAAEIHQRRFAWTRTVPVSV